MSQMPKTSPPWVAQHRLLIKAEDSTDPNYGCPPEERNAKEHMRYGVISLDKPAGPTSHEVAAWVKRIMSLKHVGHGGTLEA